MRQDYPVYLFFLSSCVITLSFYVLQGGGLICLLLFRSFRLTDGITITN